MNREQGLCYVKGHDLGGTVEPSLFIEKELSGAGGGFDGVGWRGWGLCSILSVQKKQKFAFNCLGHVCFHACEVALNSVEKSC